MKPTFRRVDERGLFLEVLNDPSKNWTAINYAKMKQGAVIGNHYHKETKLFLFLINGSAEVTIEDVSSKERTNDNLGSEEGIFLEPGKSHKVKFLLDSEFIMLKNKYDSNTPDTYDYEV